MRVSAAFLVLVASSACQHGETVANRTFCPSQGDAGVPPDAPIVTNAFTPTATTISTSEGAPYLNCDFWVAGPEKCQKTFFGYGPTRINRIYVCLSGEVSTSDCSAQPAVTQPLSTAMIADIASRIAAFANTGSRLLVRFTYNFGPSGPGAMDAPLSVMLGHLDQVAPILLQNKDIVFALEAGFIGTWGEWHDSTNGNDNAAAQKALLDKELSYFGDAFPIVVRYPGDLMQYEGNWTPPTNLALHDDYYASDADDGATWNTCDKGAGYCFNHGVTASQLQSYAAAVSTTTMFVGEFGALYPTLQSCAALDSYSYTYHPQSISLSTYPPTIGTELTNEGCALDFFNRVGTRIELQGATITGAPAAGATLHLVLTLANTGYGRVVRARPATLVFLSRGASIVQIPLSFCQLDLRTLASASTPIPHSFAFDVTLPASFAAAGAISVALSIPDPAPSLTSQAAYALPLNSVADDGTPVFDPVTGYNVFATLATE